MKKAIITTVSRGKHKGEYKFQLIAANGEPIAQSYPESYTKKFNCIKTLKNNFPDFEIVDKTNLKFENW